MLFCPLWYTGLRTGGIQAIDLEDCESKDTASEFVHTPEAGTPLKNKEGYEQWVVLSLRSRRFSDDYIACPRPG